MMKSLHSITSILLVALAACNSQSKTNLEVKGSIKNADKLESLYPGIVKNDSITLYLYEIPLGRDQQPVQLDQVTISKTAGSFTLKGIANSVGMYDISVDPIDRGGPVIPLVNDVSSIAVTADFNKKDKYYTVEGSAASKQLQDFIYKYIDHGQQYNKSMVAIDSLKKLSAADSVIIEATNTKNKSLDNLNTYVKNFLAGSSQPIVASFALGRASQTLPVKEFEAELDKLVQKFPQDATLSGMKAQYERDKAQAAEMERLRNGNNWIGKQAPELVMADPSGKNIALSSFKGKYVLVDFWASWCGPCRLENPNVVAAYNQFKDKNFTILGVSLDKTKDAWLEAIKKDGLTWTHVSDLAYWNSASVKIFGFDGIPFNVLIDPKGTVIGQSLRGEQLSEKLREVLK